MGQGQVGVDVDCEHPPVRIHVDSLETRYPPERRVVHEDAEVPLAHRADGARRGIGVREVEGERLSHDAVGRGQLLAGRVERLRLVRHE